MIRGSKVRDVTNGRILKTDVGGDVKGKICVICDDILDGGATFIELANLLREKGAIKVYLIVSHGIFSKGVTTLHTDSNSKTPVLDGIYTTDSFVREGEYSAIIHADSCYYRKEMNSFVGYTEDSTDSFVKMVPITEFYTV